MRCVNLRRIVAMIEASHDNGRRDHPLPLLRPKATTSGKMVSRARGSWPVVCNSKRSGIRDTTP
jgi:hypothetical protein